MDKVRGAFEKWRNKADWENLALCSQKAVAEVAFTRGWQARGEQLTRPVGDVEKFVTEKLGEAEYSLNLMKGMERTQWQQFTLDGRIWAYKTVLNHLQQPQADHSEYEKGLRQALCDKFDEGFKLGKKVGALKTDHSDIVRMAEEWLDNWHTSGDDATSVVKAVTVIEDLLKAAKGG